MAKYVITVEDQPGDIVKVISTPSGDALVEKSRKDHTNLTPCEKTVLDFFGVVLKKSDMEAKNKNKIWLPN